MFIVSGRDFAIPGLEGRFPVEEICEIWCTKCSPLMNVFNHLMSTGRILVDNKVGKTAFWDHIIRLGDFENLKLWGWSRLEKCIFCQYCVISPKSTGGTKPPYRQPILFEYRDQIHTQLFSTPNSYFDHILPDVCAKKFVVFMLVVEIGMKFGIQDAHTWSKCACIRYG